MNKMNPVGAWSDVPPLEESFPQRKFREICAKNRQRESKNYFDNLNFIVFFLGKRESKGKRKTETTASPVVVCLLIIQLPMV